MKFYESGEYRATKDWPYSLCAGCAVYRETEKGIEVLLLIRKAGDFPQYQDGDIDTYHLPKGHILLNELLHEAAARETAEEAGVQVEITTYLGAQQHRYKDGIKRDKIIHYFAGKWLADLPEKDDEHSDVAWVGLDEAETLLGPPNPKTENEVVQNLRNFLELSK